MKKGIIGRFYLHIFLLLLFVHSPLSASQTQPSSSQLKFAVSFGKKLCLEALDGRLLLLISDNDKREPRFQISDGPGTQLVFGIDVNGLKPGKKAFIDSTVLGYPLKSIARIPAGQYWVQVLLHRYETFHRADGHAVKLPMDRGEGQKWNRAPGNLYSTPQNIRIDPAKKRVIRIKLDKKIKLIPAAKDTKYIKHIKMKSELLSKFWGRDMFLGACVLLPEGFDEHPQARYPLVINHGHFPYTFFGFRQEPPDPNLKPNYSSRFKLKGYNKIVQQMAHKFYKTWTGPDFPRVLLIKIQHANPFYDDSYAVNSANLGPYGDAITYELIPYIEKKFRGIGQGWARFLYGGSTGGWEALAVQVFYPEQYNGCYAACPDPIDFRAYTLVNIYEDKNAYYLKSKWKRTLRPGNRNYLGAVSNTLMDQNIKELVLGSNSRSGGQWDIWQAVYSPVGDDGYPKPIWDKLSGEIDTEVANYWRENYDLRYIMERDWQKLGPKLADKVHIYCGDMDNYYLNNAVYLMEKFLNKSQNPFYGGLVDYGDRAEHCWNGDHKRPNAISRLRYHQMFIPQIVKRILTTAPAGTDLTSWRY